MTFREAGFRAFYHQMVVLPADRTLRPLLAGFPNSDETTSMLMYGYIDPEKGLMLEVLAGIKKEDSGSPSLVQTNPGIRSSISAAQVADTPFVPLSDENGDLHRKYADKLDQLAVYDVSEEVEESRTLTYLDGIRVQTDPDQVQVIFLKPGVEDETLPVRITGSDDHGFSGTLLSQPEGDFGVSKGDTLNFYVGQSNDGIVVCIAMFPGEMSDGEDESEPGPDGEDESEPEQAEDGLPRDSGDDAAPVRLAVGRMDVFNFALYQNRIHPVRDIAVQNLTGDTLEGLTLRITSDFPFFEPFQAQLPPIPSGKPVSLGDPVLHVNGNTLAGLTEKVDTTITVELCRDSTVLCGCRGRMQVLAYDQWTGAQAYPDLLPAFVLPNHPVVSSLIREAANRLKAWGKPTALDGYQSGDPNRVRDMAAAAYAAIQKQDIVYAEAPASFFKYGQRIRTPDRILSQRLGNCMDMTLLYAACLEAMGLHPLLVLIQGHIFAGVWLRRHTEKELKAGELRIDNMDALTSRFDNGADDLTFVECTAMCSDRNTSFEEAEKIAKYGGLSDRKSFHFAIDVYLTRCAGVVPVASRITDAGKTVIDYEEKADRDLTAAPAQLDISVFSEVPEEKAGKIAGKQELWESKLLDLSPHNMLLNLPLNASVEPVMSAHIDELEDALADGHEFRLLPAPEWITNIMFTAEDAKGKKSKPKSWLLEALRHCGVFELTDWPVVDGIEMSNRFRQEFRNHRLYTFREGKQLDRELTALYRAARSSQQENGVSSLYLAIGLLRWFPPETDTPCYAPMILLPIEIVRKSANMGYALHARDEEPHFNSTLLEMLREQYHLEIGGLDPLPSDEHGVHIRKVFAIMRSAVYSIPNWDVVESCVIGNFSFAQFAMWNDIHTAGDLLERSDIVRSLVRGHLDWDASLPAEAEHEEVYLPITVDATQLRAIQLASYGSTFVLHGPPGTGKSQTITGMIANLMAKGKTVLFVAEKMAALSVVQKRLSSLGIGEFCLELHSDKANKKQVLSQLERALSARSSAGQNEYEADREASARSSANLDEYAEHLHQVRRCGYSLRQLIDLYETVEPGEAVIRFDPDAAGEIPEASVRRHENAIAQLTAAGGGIRDLLDSPLSEVRMTEYDAETRKQIRQLTDAYEQALDRLNQCATRACALLSAPAPATLADLAAMRDLSGTFQAVTEAGASTGAPPHAGDAVLSYYDRLERLEKEEADLLTVWNRILSAAELRAWREKLAAAEKKLFGKAAAVSGVVAELQKEARVSLSAETLPALFEALERYQADAEELAETRRSLSPEDAEIADRFPTRSDYEKAAASWTETERIAANFPGGLSAILAAADHPETAGVLEDCRVAWAQYETAAAQLNALLDRNPPDGAARTVEQELAFCRDLRSNAALLKEQALYNRARALCVEIGLEPVVDAFESGMSAGEIPDAYRRGFYYALITNILDCDDVLCTFTGATFNESIRQFRQMDDTLLNRTKSEIRRILAANLPQEVESPEIGSELNLLRKAIGSNGRGISIRTLFAQIPHILKRLTPCMLMSPNSVAQYLAQESDLFDVVIFDEASQLPTCKAVGALMRAGHAVIVGDPKQMPPTSFFAGGGKEENFALADLDSILDDALALGIPSQYLQWHYRSSHESLIAFSNQEFYHNKMYTFPSANDLESRVTAFHVEGGVYRSGTNSREAEEVVAEILRRYRDPQRKNQSIGVVTFNVKQQALIENLLAKEFEKDPAFDAWANEAEDPLFVKNLENVQGDERDVILFSIGYGPDEKGHISMNFGPINREGGEKRLNVAFSRARVEMKIFSSMHSSDIKVTESSPDGVRALGDFLRFAEGGRIRGEAEPDSESSGADGILKSVCSALTEHGYAYQTMVGHSDFHIDIAVENPYEPSQYLLGILLDGENYRQTQNTRDREIAQIGVLKNLGWHLRRIWTVDWWDNREKEIRGLIAELDALKEEAHAAAEKKAAAESVSSAREEQNQEEERRIREELSRELASLAQEEEELAAEPETAADTQSAQTETAAAEQAEPATVEQAEPAAEEQPAAEETAAEPEAPEQAAPAAQPERPEAGTDEPQQAPDVRIPYQLAEYRRARPEAEPMEMAAFLSAANREKIGRAAAVIADEEGPILRDALYRRVLDTFGVSKTNDALAAVDKAVKAAKVKTTRLKGTFLCWQSGTEPKEYRTVRAGEDRTIDEITLPELKNAVCYALQEHGKMKKDDLLREASRVLGFKRLGKNVEARLEEAVKYARETRELVMEKGMICALPDPA